jgi:hypothetical protein
MTDQTDPDPLAILNLWQAPRSVQAMGEAARRRLLSESDPPADAVRRSGAARLTELYGEPGPEWAERAGYGPETCARLEALAAHLDPALGEYLRALCAADSKAHKYRAALLRAERAEDLARECRLQLGYRDRQVERLRADLRAATGRDAR